MSLEKELGKGMVLATRTLYSEREQWAKDRNGKDFEFDVVIGTGLRTYQLSSRSRDRFKITYGVEMIRDKLDAQKACTWLTYRELREYKFCPPNQISILNLLSHTVLHEFGHFIQTIMGVRYENSVHNEEFYKILSKAYRNNVNQEVEQLILKTIYNEDAIQKVRAPYELINYHVKKDFRLNEPVKFNYQGVVYEGKVRKKNERTCNVLCEINGRWTEIRCPYSRLEKISRTPVN